MKGFSPVRITLLASAVLMALWSPPWAWLAGGEDGIGAGRGQRPSASGGASAPMIDGLQAIDGGGDADGARLDLQRQLQRIKPGLLQVAPVKPERRLLRGAPHVAQFAFPGSWVFRCVRAEPPALANSVGDLGADQVRNPFGHGAKARGVDDEVGGKKAAVTQVQAGRGDAFNCNTAFELDATVGDEFAGPHVDVVARA